MEFYDMLRFRGKDRQYPSIIDPNTGDENIGASWNIAHEELLPTFLATAGWWHKPQQIPTRDRVLRSCDKIWRLISHNRGAFPSGPPLVSVDLEQKQITPEVAAQTLGWIKSHMPHLPITVYAPQLPPWRQFWFVFQHLIVKQGLTDYQGYAYFKRKEDVFADRYLQWKDRNEAAAYCLSLCDAITVSLYPPYVNDLKHPHKYNPKVHIAQRWRLFAREMIEEAFGLWPHKPIYPWLWHTTGPGQDHALIGSEYYRMMIDTCKEAGVSRVGLWANAWQSWDEYVSGGYWDAVVGEDNPDYDDTDGEDLEGE